MPLLLYVEDDSNAARMFKLAAAETNCGLQIVVVEDKAAAMAFLGNGSTQQDASLPDLVVLDLNLKGADGFLVLEEIRSTKHLAHLATVIFSSSQLPKDKDRAQQLGALCFVHKPIDLDQFYETVNGICAMVKH